MGQHPEAATWNTMGGTKTAVCQRFTDEQCAFLNANVGISRRTLKHVCAMINDKFGLELSYEAFTQMRADALADGRCRTTYFRNYYKGENSSERELRLQKPVLKSRLLGGCQFRTDAMEEACGLATAGRYCEAHVRAGYKPNRSASRGGAYVDSSLGKYG